MLNNAQGPQQNYMINQGQNVAGLYFILAKLSVKIDVH